MSRTALSSALLILFFSGFIFCSIASAAIRGEIVEYKQGDTVLQGYLAYDDSLKGKVPGILVVHEWTGLGTYVQRRAKEIAGLGYVAFCADIYGKGIRPKNAKEAAAQAAIYRTDRALMRQRAQAGLEELKKCRFTDPKRLAAMGYCFGGGVALELARSGAELAGVVSFHGNLDTPHPEDAKNIKAKVLVLRGADDPYVPEEQAVAFEDEMRAAKVDWEMVVYGNAVHAFTNPESGGDNSKGAAYNQEADLRSWKAMEDFYEEIFFKPKLIS
jgi:dienelactone hydrolase